MITHHFRIGIDIIRTGLIWTAIFIGAMFVIAFWVRSGIADVESVPTHWNAAGEADRFTSSSGAMAVYWILIGTAAFLDGRVCSQYFSGNVCWFNRAWELFTENTAK